MTTHLLCILLIIAVTITASFIGFVLGITTRTMSDEAVKNKHHDL